MEKLQNNKKLNYYIKFLIPIRDGLIKFSDFYKLKQDDLESLLNLCEINNYLQNLKNEEL